MNKLCCIYNYFEKDTMYKENMNYFINNNGFLEFVDYYIIINGVHTIDFPEKPNIKIFSR